MDFQRFGIDPRLAQAAEGLPTNFFFYEKMLSHVVEKQENVCVKIALDEGREEVLLLPALQWILSGEARKVLVVVPEAEGAERCSSAIKRLGTSAGIGVCRVVRDPSPSDGAAQDDSPPEPSRLVGELSSAVLIGTVEDLLAAQGIELRDYGFLVVDGVDRLIDIPSDAMRKFCACLLPSWERRSVLACARFSIKAKNLAWDLADNPSEITIEGEVAKAQSVRKETWSVPVDSKLKFVLGLLEREKPSRLCVFCNLRDTASDVARRLAANGISTDSILGALLPERKFALVEKFRAGDCTCLLLTDEAAEGLSPGVFPLIVNFDIPLEPELFVRRLEMLDRSDPGAKVVSLACDRYIAGLSAVEHYIDAKLDPLPADEAMLSTTDRSEVKGNDRRPRADAYPRDSRRSPPQRRESNPRDSRQREPNRGDPNSREPYPRESNPRDANRFRDLPREGRSPDIRKSISEATGGALDMSGGIPLPASSKPMSGKGPARGEPRHGQRSPDGRQGGNKDSRRDGNPRDAKRENDQRRAGKGPTGRQQPNRSGPPKSSVASGPVSAGNPYDMPMEERMKAYREKYGHNLGESSPRTDRGARRTSGNSQGSGRKDGPKPQRGGQHGPAKQGASKQDPAKQGVQRSSAPREPDRRPPAPRQREQQPSRPEAQRPPQTFQGEAARKPEGLVNRLLGVLRKKKS